MSIFDDIKDYTKIWTAVRITIVPPWKIEDVDGHPTVNLGAVTLAAALVLFARVFTADGSAAVTKTTLISVISVAFLTLCGLVVNFTHPGADNTKLANRWSTFFVIAFGYALLYFIALCLFVPTVFHFNLIDAFSAKVGDTIGEYSLCLVVTLLSIVTIYLRTKWWFREMLKDNALALIGTLIFATAVISGLLMCVLFSLKL